jgi:mono/diheme cytochrome c family protein
LNRKGKRSPANNEGRTKRGIPVVISPESFQTHKTGGGRSMRSAAALACILGFIPAVAVQQRGEAAGDPSRGEYIVENVAMCVQCHTPRNEAGDLLRSRLLQGAAVPFQSPYPGLRWANTAPPIAGLPQYTLEEGVRLLTAGATRTGTPLRPPMPPFRMREQDARDVVSYLKSMK